MYILPGKSEIQISCLQRILFFPDSLAWVVESVGLYVGQSPDKEKRETNRARVKVNARRKKERQLADHEERERERERESG